MASRMRVRLNVADALKGFEGFSARYPAAVASAVKRTAVAAKTVMTKAVSADTGLPSRQVSAAISLHLDIDIGSEGAAAAQLTIRGARVPLIQFKASGPEPSRGRGRGVSYRLPEGRGRVADAFIATMPSGHRGVFKRRGNSRLPIVELFGPSLPHVFAKYLPVGQERAREALIKNLQSEIRFAMTR